jgi:SH3-like domain-containing protein
MMMRKNSRGRPRRPLASVKSASVLLRLGPSEKQGFAQAAELAGVPLAIWMRERLRCAVVSELRGAGRVVPFLD